MENIDEHRQLRILHINEAGYFIYLCKLIACVILVCVSAVAYSQDHETDSLLQVVAKGKDDSLKVNALLSLTISNVQTSPQKAIAFADSARDLAIRIGFKTGEAYAYKWLGILNNNLGNYYDALVNSNKSLNIFESLDDKVGTSNLLNNLGAFYADRGEDSKGVEYYLKSLDLAKQSGNKLRIETALSNIGVIYFKNPATNDKALSYYLQALPYALEIKDEESIGIIYTNIGEVYTATNDFDKAYYYYQKALDILGTSISTAYTYTDLGKLFIKKKVYDSAAFFFNKSFDVGQQNSSPLDVVQSLIGKGQLQVAKGNTKEAINIFNQALAIGKPLGSAPELKEIYNDISLQYEKINDYKNAFAFQSLLNELYQSENQKKLSFNTATLEYAMELQRQSEKISALMKQNEQQELNIAKEKLARNVLLGGLGIVLIFVFVLLINTNQRKRLNKLLSRQKKEIEIQKSSVEKALDELKATQAQLIHSEKMASLGELTSGVAHEIQNPLNFVNNFSEVNRELIDELTHEVEKGNIEDVIAIANDIRNNEDKIIFHGKRADAIVKGMLQHSRKNTGQTEPVPINSFVAEYVRLSYHGMKAKNKFFHVETQSDFDPSIGTVDIIPQDIGMVLLNLLNNAFYAVIEKLKAEGESYKPTVTVQTKNLNNKIEISVADNGNGIPQSILDKIFQPFFTTKPTGEGTGLGLSLSYDIIKARGGEIKVETKEGGGTKFIILLPVV